MHSYAATIGFVFSVASASLSIFLSGCHIIIALLYARLIATSSPCPFSRPSTSYGVSGSVPILMVQAPALLAFRMYPCVPPEPTPEQYHIQGLKSWAGTSAGVGERARQESRPGCRSRRSRACARSALLRFAAGLSVPSAKVARTRRASATSFRVLGFHPCSNGPQRRPFDKFAVLRIRPDPPESGTHSWI